MDVSVYVLVWNDTQCKVKTLCTEIIALTLVSCLYCILLVKLLEHAARMILLCL